jgi:hypothetical protein
MKCHKDELGPARYAIASKINTAPNARFNVVTAYATTVLAAAHEVALHQIARPLNMTVTNTDL